MRIQMLTSKHCKSRAIFYKRIIPTDITKSITFASGVPFMFGFTNSEDSYQTNISVMRTKDTSITIQTFRELDLEIGDKIRFDNQDYFVESFNNTYYESTQFKNIKQYFITIK